MIDRVRESIRKRESERESEKVRKRGRERSDAINGNLLGRFLSTLKEESSLRTEILLCQIKARLI